MKFVWMEKGNDTEGLNHILQYEAAFLARGVKKDEIVDVAKAATKVGRRIGYQGTRTGRPIVVFMYKIGALYHRDNGRHERLCHGVRAR